LKINLKNTRLLLNISVINFVFFTLFIFTNPAVTLNSTGYIWLFFFEFSLFYVLLLIYLVNVISYLNENASIAAAFTMYAGLTVIGFIDVLLPSFLNSSYASTLGILTEVISLFATFQSFKIKDRTLSIPFKLFGIAIFLNSFSKLILIFAIPSINEKLENIYGQISLGLTLLAAFYLLKRIKSYLMKNEEQLSKPTA
jgi:hypothetical protein